MKLQHSRRASAPSSKLKKVALQSIPASVLVHLRNPNLTRRELEVLLLYLEWGNDKKLAASLDISAHTVRIHLAIIEHKAGAACREELLLHYWKMRAQAQSPPFVPFAVVARRRNPDLTEREMEVLLLFLDLGNVHRIAESLDLAEHTVHNHLRSVQTKLDLEGREEMILYFWKNRAEPNRPR